MPVFRLPLFWLGLLVLIFIGWSWRDSLRVETSAMWDGRELVQIRNADSAVEIYIAEGAGSGSSGFRTEKEMVERPDLPKAAFHRAMIDDQPTYQATLPHWLMMGVCLLIWVPALLIRRIPAKREVRHGG